MKRSLIVLGLMALGACSENGLTTQLRPESLDPSAVLAPGNNVDVVTESDVARQVENTLPTNNWVLYTRAGTPATAGAFEVGPGSPPLGVGSLRTITNVNSEKVFLFNYDHIGTPLTSITGISYGTYKTATATSPAFPSLNIQIDINGGTLNPGEFSTLVFEPYYQPGANLATGVWQTRDAYAGGAAIWWSTNPVVGCPQGAPCTWSAILAAIPNASIVGGFGINQGSFNPGIDGNSDALSIAYGGNSITYDFEPYEVAGSKDACKDGGWSSLKRADGSSFKNQGDCISYVNTGS